MPISIILPNKNLSFRARDRKCLKTLIVYIVGACMKITFLSDAESGVNVFPELFNKLKGEIADIETEEVFVPARDDLPKKAMDLAQETDMIFVLLLCPERNARVDLVVGKLIDVEIKTGISIVKAVEETDISSLESEDELDMEKEAIAEKWAAFLASLLFHPEEFAPKK
jgi:riboflavin synthase